MSDARPMHTALQSCSVVDDCLQIGGTSLTRLALQVAAEQLAYWELP